MIMMTTTKGNPQGQPPRPEISYPCLWAYRIVGMSETEMRSAVAAVLRTSADRQNNNAIPHTLKPANTSANGQYQSMHLELRVKSESHHNEIFAALSSHEKIRFVL